MVVQLRSEFKEADFSLSHLSQRALFPGLLPGSKGSGRPQYTWLSSSRLLEAVDLEEPWLDHRLLVYKMALKSLPRGVVQKSGRRFVLGFLRL